MKTPRRASRVAIVSPTYLALIKKTRYGLDAFWSLPGGRAEPWDRGPVRTAHREALEEVQIAGLNMRHLAHVWEGVRYVHGRPEDLVLFWVSDELILTAPPHGDENGEVINIGIFRRDSLPTDFRQDHLPLLELVIAYLKEHAL